MSGADRYTKSGRCERASCSNTGTLHLVEATGPNGFKRDKRRGVEAGRRWYCDSCNDGFREMVRAAGILDHPHSIENVETGEVRIVSATPGTLQ